MEVLLYSKPACHLCDILEAQLEELRGVLGITVRKVDIRADPALWDDYGERIPVLEAGGAVIAQGRIDTGLLERRLRRVLTL